MCASIIPLRHPLPWQCPSMVCICCKGREQVLLITAFVVTSVDLACCRVHCFYPGTALEIVKNL